MTSSRLAAVLAALTAACGKDKQPLASIAPKDHYTASLEVPGSNRPVDVELYVPHKYEMDQYSNKVYFRGDRERDPEILLRSSAPNDDGHKPNWPTRNCDEGQTGPYSLRRDAERTSIVRSERRPDGWVEVCRFTFHAGDPLHGTGASHTSTRVVREVRWGGVPFQCQVTFVKNQSPSNSRIEDAIAICDSMHIRAKPLEAISPGGEKAACPLRSFTPSERRTGVITLDDKHVRSRVAVDVEVPEGYELVDSDSLQFHREHCPDVVVFPVTDMDMPLTEQGCSVTLEPVVIQQEPRADGSVAVCETRDKARPMGWFVVRRIRRGERDWLCEVQFDDWDWIQDQASATPSRDRFKDAIAVCDSVRFREPTTQEKSNVESAGTGEAR